VNTEIIEANMKNFLLIFDNIPINLRQNKTENNLNEYNELHYLMLNYSFYKKDKFSYLSDLPEPRVLVGLNTNKKFSELPSCDPIIKSKVSPLNTSLNQSSSI